jgi:hypothetical protein
LEGQIRWHGRLAAKEAQGDRIGALALQTDLPAGRQVYAELAHQNYALKLKDLIEKKLQGQPRNVLPLIIW